MLVGGLKVYIIKMSLYESIADLVNTLGKNFLWYITRKRYEREVLEYLLPLNLSLISLRRKRCVLVIHGC